MQAKSIQVWLSEVQIETMVSISILNQFSHEIKVILWKDTSLYAGKPRNIFP